MILINKIEEKWVYIDGDGRIIWNLLSLTKQAHFGETTFEIDERYKFWINFHTINKQFQFPGEFVWYTDTLREVWNYFN